jgi:hypothetical protein
VPPVQPSSVALADVYAVPVAPVQLEDDVSSVAGRAGTPGPRVVWLESRTLRPCVAWVESWAPRGAQPKSVKKVTMVLRRVT